MPQLAAATPEVLKKLKKAQKTQASQSSQNASGPGVKLGSAASHNYYFTTES